MKKLIALTLCCFSAMLVSSQNIGIGTTTPNVNAALEIKASNKGLLMPRLSTTARKNMPAVPKGMIVFDSTYNSFYYHDGSKWRPVSDNNPDSLLTDNGLIPRVTANMSAVASTNAISGTLYDNGGPSANYANNSTNQYTVEPTLKKDSTIALSYKVIVEEMNLESPYDSLEIYVSGDYEHRQVFTGNRTGTFYFPVFGRYLEFVFKSNGVNNLPGFKIRWGLMTTNIDASEPPPSYGWYFNFPKIAVRGGTHLNNGWAADSLGILSFAYGYNTKAKGEASFAIGSLARAGGSAAAAIGYEVNARGTGSLASGYYTYAGGDYSVAMGEGSRALSHYSVAMGENAIASDYNAVAMGSYVTASGWGAVAMGNGAIASGGGSFATGSATKATGHFSVAMGSNSEANGESSVAFGKNNKANGPGSTALGLSTTALGTSSTALGQSTVANGINATAMGFSTLAAGTSSLAAGNSAIANGQSAVALGTNVTAGADYSLATGQNSFATGLGAMAMGWYNTSGSERSVSVGSVNSVTAPFAFGIGSLLNVAGTYATAMGTRMIIPDYAPGSFGIGDLEYSTNPVDHTILAVPNQMVTRFRGGYFFMSSANAPNGTESQRTGVKINPGQNSWSAISDVRLKEKFEPVNGEDILDKIAGMPLTTWNYKGQDAKTFRHYGPMAQDFFAAFGKDRYGMIGCDTLINQQDFLGVNLVAIQALEKRTATYKEENKQLKEQVESLKVTNELLIRRLDALEKRMRR